MKADEADPCLSPRDQRSSPKGPPMSAACNYQQSWRRSDQRISAWAAYVFGGHLPMDQHHAVQLS